MGVPRGAQGSGSPGVKVAVRRGLGRGTWSAVPLPLGAGALARPGSEDGADRTRLGRHPPGRARATPGVSRQLYPAQGFSAALSAVARRARAAAGWCCDHRWRRTRCRAGV